MLSAHQETIRSKERRLWEVARRIARSGVVPQEQLQELERAVFRLTAYVVDLQHQKSRVDKAWAELEAQ